jgi:hypothetical protein
VIYRLPHSVLDQTFATFRTCGRGQHECQVLWTSSWQSCESISKVYHPAHRAHMGGFDVDSAWLTKFWLELAAAGDGARVQIHTHPGEAFHSSTDDEYPMIHTPGFLSLVIPNFGLGRVGFEDAYLAEIMPDGRWRGVEIGDRLKVV